MHMQQLLPCHCLLHTVSLEAQKHKDSSNTALLLACFQFQIQIHNHLSKGRVPDHFMLLKHVVLDTLDGVAILDDARTHALVEAGKVAKRHQGLEVLQSLALGV